MITKNPDRSTLQDRGERRGHVIACLLLAVAVFGTYAVCLTNMVAHGDDYWLLWEPEPVLKVWNAAGRWASGMYFQAAWYGADSVGDLWRPRLTAIVGIFLLAVGIYASLWRLKYSWQFSIAVASLSVMLPTFGVYAAWATCSGHVYACLTAMAAFWLAEAGRWRTAVWQSAAFVLAAAGVLFVGFSIYQPAAMFYVTLLMMAIGASGCAEWSQVQARPGTRRPYGLLQPGAGSAGHGIVLLAAMAANVLVFRLMAGEVEGIDIAERAAITSDLVTKAGRFVLQPVGQSCVPYFFVNHWSKWQMFPFEVAVLGVVVPVGLWLRFEGSAGKRLLRTLALLALIPATYVPNLVIASDFFPHRTRPAISVAILFLLLLATAGYLRRVAADERRRQRIAAVGLAAVFGVAFALARYHLDDYFFAPSRVEWEVVCAEVRQAVERGPSRPRRVVFLMPDSNRPVARRFIYDEFGYMSASSPWVCEGMTGLAVRQVAPDKMASFRDAEFVKIPRAQPPPPAVPQDWVINARRLNGLIQPADTDSGGKPLGR